MDSELRSADGLAEFDVFSGVLLDATWSRLLVEMVPYGNEREFVELDVTAHADPAEIDCLLDRLVLSIERSQEFARMKVGKTIIRNEEASGTAQPHGSVQNRRHQLATTSYVDCKLRNSRFGKDRDAIGN